jgi:S1-C subfamily serine protease
VIAGQRILTNAHVVANQTFVLVRKHGTSTKYRAEVEAVGHECDLALLKVPNEDFWEGMDPLEFGEIPQLQEQVAVVGYPQGGERQRSVPVVIDFQIACRAGCVRKRTAQRTPLRSASNMVRKLLA